MKDTDCYLDSFEYLLRGRMVERFKDVRSKKRNAGVDEGNQTLPQPALRSTPDTRKRLREPTASPEETNIKKPVEKRPKASNKEEEWVEVPNKKDLRKKKVNKPTRTPERPRRPRPEAVLRKPAEGMSYATLLSCANLRSPSQYSQNVDVNGPHHRCFELIMSSSFNQPMAVERGRSHELVGSMVGAVYVHVLQILARQPWWTGRYSPGN